LSQLILILVPFCVLALVALFGFVGCDGQPFVPGEGPPAGTTFESTYAEEVQDDQPVAWWRLGDTDLSGAAADQVPSPPGNHPGKFNDLDGVLEIGQPPLNNTDPTVSSTFFDGGYVSVDVDIESLASHDFTIEALVMPLWPSGAPNPDSPSRRAVVASHDPAAGTGWALVAAYDGQQWQWQGQIWGGAQSPPVTTPTRPITFGEKVIHLALTYDHMAGGDLRLFVNPVETPPSPLVETPPTAGSLALNMTGPLCIGAETAGTGATNPFNGLVQEVALYDHPLSPDRIQARITDLESNV
jgi:hypothetical protein